MQINGGLLDLRIIPCKTCYKLCCLDNLFLETNRNLEWYYKTFHKYDKNYHYDIKLSDNIFYKEFDKEFNIIVAISEFVHFFVLLDEFIINNAVIGNEENFD